jgi:hypothetical protein
LGLTWIDKRNENKVLVTLYTINKEDASQKEIIASNLDNRFVKDSETLSHHRDFASINCFWLVLSTKARLNKKVLMILLAKRRFQPVQTIYLFLLFGINKLFNLTTKNPKLGNK